MSSLTIALRRAMARLWSPGDDVVVSELDHDANVSPRIALEEQGMVIKRIPARLDDCILDTEALNELLTPRTRLVAITHASNVFGSVTDLPRVAQLADAVGALRASIGSIEQNVFLFSQRLPRTSHSGCPLPSAARHRGSAR